MSNTHEGVLASRGGLVNALKVTGLLALPLILGSRFVDWDSLVGLNTTLNDQVGYVSVARNWADSGTLNSNLIYPSVLTRAGTGACWPTVCSLRSGPVSPSDLRRQSRRHGRTWLPP